MAVIGSRVQHSKGEYSQRGAEQEAQGERVSTRRETASSVKTLDASCKGKTR